MFWLLGGKSFAVAVAAVAGLDFVSYQLAHSAWTGLRYYDLIWPSFMLMVGVSIPFSLSKVSTTRARSAFLWSTLRRASVLFLLGSMRETLHDGVPRLVELSSALQPIAIAYLISSCLAWHSMRTQIAVAATILSGYAALLAWVPATGLPAGTYELNRNLVTAVDHAVLGRAHKDGWGTVLTIIPTIATTLLGLVLGRVLRQGRSRTSKLTVLILTGLGCLLAGLALSPIVPVIMKLWTTSYGLMSAGWACLLFALFFWIVDVQGWRRWSFPLVVIGVNALAAYLMPTLLPVKKVAGILTASTAKELGTAAAVLTTGTALLAGWLLLWWMYRRKLFLRA
jgi:predicted acyltransferase